MFKTLKSKKAIATVGLSWMAAAVIAGAAQVAAAGFEFAPPRQPSSGPCQFSEQLQISESARRQYLAKVVAAVGGTFQASSSVEEMYGRITPVSYQEESYDQALPERNIWGFETKRSARHIGLDAFSLDCLNCHDGVGAAPVSAVLRNNPFNKSHRNLVPGNDHPIGMDYNQYAAASSEYKPLSLFNNKMLLVNGKVGCLTCHNPLNPEKGHLVMSDRNSALCLTCHNK